MQSFTWGYIFFLSLSGFFFIAEVWKHVDNIVTVTNEWKSVNNITCICNWTALVTCLTFYCWYKTSRVMICSTYTSNRSKQYHLYDDIIDYFRNFLETTHLQISLNQMQHMYISSSNVRALNCQDLFSVEQCGDTNSINQHNTVCTRRVDVDMLFKLRACYQTPIELFWAVYTNYFYCVNLYRICWRK